MNAPKKSAERASLTAVTTTETANAVVFQPQKLRDVVEIVNLMGAISNRIREDNSGDLGGGGGGGTAQGTQQTGTSARDEAIAKAPDVPIMQKKLVEYLDREIRTIQRQASQHSRSNARGSAWMLSELYRKIRRLRSLMSEILDASAAMIKRFYVSVFIDRQPIVVTGGSIVQADE